MLANPITHLGKGSWTVVYTQYKGFLQTQVQNFAKNASLYGGFPWVVRVLLSRACNPMELYDHGICHPQGPGGLSAC